MADKTAIWRGASGTPYTYWVYELPASPSAGQSGNYILARISRHGWIPVYIGQGDIGERLDSRDQAACVRSKGATHFHAHKNVNERSRLEEENDLLAGYPQAYTPNGCNVRNAG
jgi:hypothetical protein